MTDDPRLKLMHDLMMTCAGHSSDVVIAALSDALVSAIGFAADDRRSAERFIRVLPADLRRTLASNWDYLRAERAQSSNARRTA